jgi:hypothetical protein
VNQRIPPRFALLLALSLGGLAACEIITSTDESKLLDPASGADGGAGDAATPDGDGDSGDTSTDSGGGGGGGDGDSADSGADAG